MRITKKVRFEKSEEEARDVKRHWGATGNSKTEPRCTAMVPFEDGWDVNEITFSF